MMKRFFAAVAALTVVTAMLAFPAAGYTMNRLELQTGDIGDGDSIDWNDLFGDTGDSKTGKATDTAAQEKKSKCGSTAAPIQLVSLLAGGSLVVLALKKKP